ncbi:MAG: hypothetical protein EBU90_06875 [Proteobacteria bacterium]|nr:hypothetical protein [Pseudomonadota bacterium]NBP14029.1 hypothetical protein [bacterium]
MSSIHQAISLGQFGCLVEGTPATLVNPTAGKRWTMIQVVNDTRFHTLTNTLASPSSDSLAHVTAGSAPLIPAGIVLYGNFTALQLHQGIVIAYFGD